LSLGRDSLAQGPPRVLERSEIDLEGNRPCDVRKGTGEKGAKQDVHRTAGPENNQKGETEKRGKMEKSVENGATEKSKPQRTSLKFDRACEN
jgi:hypothetical protein